LLSTFELFDDGSRLSLPLGAQRLLAFLALQKNATPRSLAAERLWPHCTPCRAAANLRSALFHVRRAGSIQLIDCANHTLRLSPAASADLQLVSKAASEVTAGLNLPPELQTGLIDALRRDLLPDWSEDWLVLERDHWDQLRLHSLETLARQLYSEQRYVQALQTALSAVAIDPVRETAHRIVMEVHIAEGNAASALKRYHDYRAFLHRELNVGPSQQMTQLLRDLMPT
jgi:DNA-binding SARP family transcriptional activator